MNQIPLANAELAIMNLLWQEERLTAKQLREKLYPDSSKSQHGTVQKLLKRLEEKGYIKRDASLSVHFFSAVVSHQTYTCRQLESLADKLTGGSFAPLITNLIENKKISKKEINRLRAILNEEQENGGKK